MDGSRRICRHVAIPSGLCLSVVLWLLAAPPVRSDDPSAGLDRSPSHAVAEADPAAIDQSAPVRIYLPLAGIFTRSDLVEAAELPSAGWLHIGPTGEFHDLAVDEARGLLWVATEGGLLRWHPEDDTRLRYSHRPIQLVAVDSAGRVWSGGGDTDEAEALQLLVPGAGRPEAIEGLPAGVVVAIEPDPSGGVWLALASRWLGPEQREGGGLLRIEADGSRRLFGRGDGLPSSDVVALAADGLGGVWMAFGDNIYEDRAIGVAYLQADGSLRVEGESEGLANPAVRAVAAAADGRLLALANDSDGPTSTDLYLREADGRWHETGPPRELLDRMWSFRADDVHPASVQRMAISRTGRWWLLAPGGIFLRAPDGSWEIRPEQGDAIDGDLALAIESALYQPRLLALGDGGAWLAGRRTDLVAARSDGGWSRHSGQDDLPMSQVRDLSLDEQGQPWVVGGSAYQLGRDARWQELVDEARPVAGRCGGSDEGVIVERAPDGSIWVGDQDAVYQVLPDGSRKIRGSALGVGRVQAIAFATDGRAWVGGSEGLARELDGGRWQRFGSADGLPSDDVLSIAFDAEGRIWVGTQPSWHWESQPDRCFAVGEGAVADLVPGQGWRVHRPPPPASSRSERLVADLIVAADGSLQVAVGNDLYRLERDGTWQRITLDVGLDGEYPVTALEYDHDGSLWLATMGDGVRRVRRDGSWDRFSAGGGKVGDAVRSIHVGPDGSIWFGHIWGGPDGARVVRRFPDGQWKPLKEGWDAFWAHEALSIAVDLVGHAWIGTGQDRLYRWREVSGFEAIVAHGRMAGAASSLIAVEPGIEGRLWLASRDGLLRREPGGRTRTWHRADGLPSAAITGLAPEPDGGLWVGFGFGLGAVFPPVEGGIGHLSAEGRFEDLGAQSGLDGMRIRDLALGPDGRLLAAVDEPIGSQSRIFDFRAAGLVDHDPDSGIWRRATTAQGLPSDAVRDLLIDAAGQLWASTELGLATSLDGRAWERAEVAPGLSDRDLHALEQAPDGSLWVGATGGAMRRDAQGAWTWIAHGAGPAAVVEVRFDPNGNAWMLLDHRGSSSIALRYRSAPIGAR